nr:MAG TPA: replication protein O [Caudoviricetes sp.]
MSTFKRPGRYAALAAGYYDDPAVIAAGPDAEILYIRMISWCAMHPETDGVIPLEVTKSRLGFTDAPTRLKALEANSLVTVDDTTVTITSWIRWNGSWSDIKAADDARKASARERKARQRARQAAAKTNPETAAPAPEETPAPALVDTDEPAADTLEATVIDQDADTSDAPTPTRERPDVEAVCDHMADSVAARTGRRPRITKRWRDAARLMIDRDQRPTDQIHAAIDWVAQSDFWAANILGLPKLREKWDTIYLQARREKHAQSPRVTRAEEFRARQRAKAEEIDAMWATQTQMLAIEGGIQ